MGRTDSTGADGWYAIAYIKSDPDAQVRKPITGEPEVSDPQGLMRLSLTIA